MSFGLKVGMVAAAIAALGGCRVKSVDSYLSATTPNSGTSPANDPYSYGGVAYATGGLEPQMSYGTGARGEHDGASDYYSKTFKKRGDKTPKWTVDGNPPNERTSQFIPPGVGRVKDAAGSPFGTLAGY